MSSHFDICYLIFGARSIAPTILAGTPLTTSHCMRCRCWPSTFSLF